MSSNGSIKCESWWDGIYQWPDSAPGTIRIPCQKIFAQTMGQLSDAGQREHVYALRLCLQDGQWGWNKWTNYTDCLNLLAMQEKDNSDAGGGYLHGIASYVVMIFLIASLVSLIISIVIFTSFKPLQCLRIRVHKNLCVALLMNCALYVLMNSLVGIHKVDLSVQADWLCKMIKALNIYSSMATINWMFVEGFIFHKTLSAPFHQNTRYYQWAYYSIGWLLPGIFVLTWALCVEFVSSVADRPCWEGYRSSNTIFIVSLPMIICVAINFGFLINIIRILLTKLRADLKSDDSATLKAIKATAFLIPLLGIHHLVVLYNPSTFDRRLVNIYIVVNMIFQSIQGIIVATLYCFTSQEVKQVLNAAWSRRRLSLAPMTAAGNGNNKRRRQSNTSNLFPSTGNLNNNGNGDQNSIQMPPRSNSPLNFLKRNSGQTQEPTVTDL